VPAGGADGVLAALGDLTGGFVLRAADGRLSFTCSRGGEAARVTAGEPLAAGRRTVGVRFRPGSDPAGTAGSLSLLDGGAEIASVPLDGPWPVSFQHGGTGLRVGYDRGLPVDTGYRPPHRWNGVLHELVIDTAAVPEPDLEAELRTALHSD
jgi:arylsulfatase